MVISRCHLRAYTERKMAAICIRVNLEDLSPELEVLGSALFVETEYRI